MFCRTIKVSRSLYHAFSLHATQPPEIGAIAKITLLHRMAYEKALLSSELMSLGMKVRNRHVKNYVYKNVLELQSSWNMSRAHLPNWNQLWTHFFHFCIIRPLMSWNQRSPD
ncbi:hypothetical protein AVEN_42824-1 [Araneus ventricosus]|uniref:Uncharacterized protein n=1 Tax=Araneus ventricosus TaxID=182803 RepID=A0A4Y2AG32_ARAVE|nr:hypothetical protein AVEN_42824-1 [Araneus ventricosus]